MPAQPCVDLSSCGEVNEFLENGTPEPECRLLFFENLGMNDQSIAVDQFFEFRSLPYKRLNLPVLALGRLSDVNRVCDWCLVEFIHRPEWLTTASSRAPFAPINVETGKPALNGSIGLYRSWPPQRPPRLAIAQAHFQGRGRQTCERLSQFPDFSIGKLSRKFGVILLECFT